MEPCVDLGARRFRHPFRKYQQQALEAFDRDRLEDTRSYLVMPPGSGKTVVGLEAARRIGRRTLVLVPNNAVLGQWVDTWNGDFVGDGPPCGADRTLATPLTVLTYQSIAVIDESTSAADRRRVMAGKNRQALLDLLHPNGRDVVERAAGLGPWTLVLDECHHLLDLWGALVRAIIDTLGPHTAVVGLTATPATLLTGRQRELCEDIFGEPDFEVPTPALVKEGDLAPYQELVYLTEPTIEEDTWLAAEAGPVRQPATEADRPAAGECAAPRMAASPGGRARHAGGVLVGVRGGLPRAGPGRAAVRARWPAAASGGRSHQGATPCTSRRG